MDEAIKFLLINVVSAYNGIIFNEYALISFNELLMEFESLDKNENTICIPPIYFLSNLYPSRHSIFKDVDKSYKKNDITRLKKLLFGDIIGEKVELFVNSALIGIRSDGLQVKAFYTGGNNLGFSTEIIDNSNNGYKHNKLITKLNLAGVSSRIASYDCGFICLDRRGIKYIDPQDCAVLTLWNTTFTDKKLNNICIDADKLYELRNVSIGCLIQSGIDALIGCRVKVENMVYSTITEIDDCKLHLGNVSSLHMLDIKDSLIEFDSAYNIYISGDIVDSTIKFNCNLTKGMIRIDRHASATRSRFIFTQNVDIMALKQMIDSLRGRASVKANGAMVSIFRVVLSSAEYKRCKASLDKKYMIYLEE